MAKKSAKPKLPFDALAEGERLMGHFLNNGLPDVKPWENAWVSNLLLLSIAKSLAAIARDTGPIISGEPTEIVTRRI